MRVDVRANHVTWEYPQIYRDLPLDALHLHLSHTRAANSLRIEYSGERDGWVISMPVCYESGYAPDADEFIEQAFIPAWCTERPDPETP